MALSPLPPLPPSGMQVIAVAQSIAVHDWYDPDMVLEGLIGAGQWLIGDVNPVAMRAYSNAVARKAEFTESAACNIDVFMLAAVGKIESNHGTGVPEGSSTLADNGDSHPEIRSPAGAIGPMQFMPASWTRYGADGNGDGTADPNNIFDAAIAGMRHLCANPSPPELQTPEGRARAVIAYNCGPGCLSRDTLPAETRKYVDRAETLYQQYKAMATPLGGLPVGVGGTIICGTHAVNLANASQAAAQAIALACSQIGDPYVWGAPAGRYVTVEDPIGFDCSGLLAWAYYLGSGQTLRIGGTADMQMKGWVPKVSLAALAPGDLLYYDGPRLGTGNADHVMMYLGDGMMIHASPGVGVEVRPWSGAYRDRTVAAGRPA